VLSAPDAEQALRIAASHAGEIQLLVTDVIMPGAKTGECWRKNWWRPTRD